MRQPRRGWSLLLVALLAACGARGKASDEAGRPFITLTELFASEDSPADNLDSLAYWPSGPWVVATAKSTDQLVVLDARDGRVLRRFGERGGEAGQFRRPNGVMVHGNLAFITERDNHRVQVVRLPEFTPVGLIGNDVLRYPYGLALSAAGEGLLDLWVTDNYWGPDLSPPPREELGERVKHFRVAVGDEHLEAQLVRSFGATVGDGVLTTVESIAVDPTYDRLLVADETLGVQNIKVYSLAGEFTGQIMGAGLFAAEPEGIALVPRGDDGYWIATDQRKHRTVFHIFDRRSLRHLGSAAGEITANTDGIAVGECAELGEVRLYAVHDDRSVVGFSFSALLTALAKAAR